MSDSIKLTDWIQAFGSLSAVVVALFAFLIARQTFHAPYRTLIKPVEIISDTSSLRNGIQILNVGPGIAYNVSVQAGVKLAMTDKYMSYNFKTGEGDSELQAKESKKYWIIEHSITPSIPFIIRYETLTGLKCTEAWKFKANNARPGYTFEKLSYFNKMRHIYFRKTRHNLLR